MQKFKVFLTIFILYEFFVLTVLQIWDYCIGLFNYNFCEMGNYKYFLLGIIVPTLIGLIFWWLSEIGRLFCGKSCATEIRNKKFFNEILSRPETERLIIAFAILFFRRLLKKYPKLQDIFNSVIKKE